MSGVSENTDSATTSRTPIHFNADDWLHFLQRFTPSSIESLRQVLRTPAGLSVPSDVLPSHSGITQAYPSALASAATVETSNVTSHNAPVVMSLNISKSGLPSMLTVPSVLNVTKSMQKPMANTIVLPSSTLLISPTAGQPISLESCISGINRLLANSVTSSGGSGTNCRDSLSSLNALATAAAAVASTASNLQTQSSSEPIPSSSPLVTSSGVSCTTTVTTTTTITTSSTTCQSDTVGMERFSTSMTASSCSSTNVRTGLDGLLHSLCGLQSPSELSPQLPSALGTTGGLTVYPVQVAANGSTVFLATQTIPNSQGTKTLPLPHGLNLLGTGGVPNSSSTSSANSTGSCPSTPLLTASSPLLASTPISKPKFKALWETQCDSGRASLSSSTDTTRTTDSTAVQRIILADSSSLTSSCLTNPISVTRISTASGSVVGLRGVGQTPKRLAVDERSLVQTSDGPKRLLLVSSQPKPASVDSGVALTGTPESLLSRALQPRLVASSRVDVKDVSHLLVANNLSSDPKSSPALTSQQPSLSTHVNILPDVRPAIGAISSSAEHPTETLISSFSESRLESGLTNRNFDPLRRMFKEEPVGEDEARRRAKRRERNRVAAARCRQRRQDQITELQHRVSSLTKTGEELRCSLVSLNAERSRLEAIVRQHGADGCTEADELLNSMVVSVDSLESLVDTQINNNNNNNSNSKDPRQQQQQRLSATTAFFNAADLLRATSLSTATSTNPPGLILIANNLDTEMLKNRSIVTTSRDLCSSSTSVNITAPPNLVLPSTHSDLSLVAKTSDVNSAASSAVNIKLDESSQLANTPTTTTTTTHAPTRPMNLFITRDSKPSDQTTTATTPSGTPTPCFLPSDLQAFAPILSPLWIKLTKNCLSISPQTNLATALLKQNNTIPETSCSTAILETPPSGELPPVASTAHSVSVKPEPTDDVDMAAVSQ